MKTSGLKLTSVFILSAILVLSTVTYGQATATPATTAGGQPEIYFVPDVIGQFNQLALRPDALAFGIGGQPDPTTGQHFQGIVRKHGPGMPYLFLSRSGNDVIECPFCDDKPGNIFIVRMESRDINGERLRSNRLIRDWAIAAMLPPGDVINPWPAPPDQRDKTVARIDFNGQNGWPNYAHPGGMQMIGDVLVVPLERPYTEGDLKNRILFIDVSSPETPALKSQFDPWPGTPSSSDFGAGLVAVTPVRNPNGPGERYIMLVAGGENKEVRLYRSLSTTFKPDGQLDENGPTDLKSTDLNWEFVRAWVGGELDDPGKDTWPCCGDSKPHQMFNFVREGSLDGPLFLIGARNTHAVLTPGSGEDVLDLYRVHVDQFGNPGDDLLTRVERKTVSTSSIGGGGDTSHFTGSTGVYVSPSGELIVYGSEHDNDGPPQMLPNGEKGRLTVRFGEWRHREMVRPGSPTLKPSVEPLSPSEVNEGSTATLRARGKAPITKAWLQLFEDDGMGLSLPDGLFDTDSWVAIDSEDWPKDNYDDFTKLLWYFNDNAGSWRWFAPVGCTMQANQHSFGDSDFPGRRKTLVGKGLVEEAADLDAVQDDQGEGSMDDIISSTQFLCDAYYTAPIGVSWDLDLDGTFERTGNSVTFSAAELDGGETPTLHPVPVRAQHPTDTTPLGQSAPATFDVRILNVAPSIASLDLVDALKFKVGPDVPFAVTNLRYEAEASFTDPGRPDTQTARLDFGDGTTLESDEFDSFSDASGGATGRLSQSHRYRAPGTYTIALEVEDDDGGVTAATSTVTVVSPAQVIGWVVKEIDRLLATITNQKAVRALRDARDNLVGSNNGSANNGALDALEGGDLVAALEKIKAAIEALGRAEAAGAGDLRSLKYLLGFTAESVAEGAYQEAETAVGTPSPGQAAQLETIRQAIVEGHALLVNGAYLPAVDLFKDAAGRALSLP
jgi:hypothetical protein